MDRTTEQGFWGDVPLVERQLQVAQGRGVDAGWDFCQTLSSIGDNEQRLRGSMEGQTKQRVAGWTKGDGSKGQRIRFEMRDWWMGTRQMDLLMLWQSPE